MLKSIKKFFIILIVVGLASLALYITYKIMFPEERKNILKRRVQNYTGFNLTITVYSYDGTPIKTWHNVDKITSGHSQGQNYVYFYTRDNRYVQLPHSAIYIAEEEKKNNKSEQ